MLRVDNEDARIWYMKEAVITEIQEKTRDFEKNKYELIKSPVIAEFLGFSNEESFLESDLESAILSHIRDFLMELGKGFAFVARQQHIVTETDDYYIDLVFYNIELRCYVLIDLKMGKITHQDVGQIDMYVRMYDDLKCKEGDNPTIGILLCAETDEDIARYSVLHDNNRLFMSKYLTYLPTKEQLKTEIAGGRCTENVQQPPYVFLFLSCRYPLSLPIYRRRHT